MKKKAACLLFAACIGVFVTLFMLTFSLATSPVYPHNFSYDSAFFRLVGSQILKGKTPYLDIWDHKGPVLFFIQALGAVGGTTNKGKNILFLLQLLAAYFSVFFMYMTYKTVSGKNGPRWKFFGILICVAAVFSLTIESGNLTEEWCIPMTSLSFYLLMKYSIEAEEPHTQFRHPYIYAFFHGLSLGLMTLIRANNAIPVCAGLIIIGIFLITKREWKNICLNILFGILGIACIWLPVFGWFHARGALSKMIYASFTFNLKYMGVRSFIRYTGKAFVSRYLPIIVSIVILILFWIKTRSLLRPDFVTAAVLISSAWMLKNTNVYLHYFTVFIPVFFLVLIRCSDRLRIPEAVILLALCVWFGKQNVKRIPALIDLHRQPQMFTAADQIPYDERDSVIAVSMPAEIYLNYDLEPVSRFCTYQHVYFGISQDLKAEFLKTLNEDPPLWILAFCSGETNIPEVQELIDSKYRYRFDQSDVCYYRLADPE